MQVEANKVVSFHYSVVDADPAAGTEAIDSSRERGEPLTVLIGHGAIVPGLENALLGHAVGDRFDVEVLPADGYGERNADMVQRVPKKYFQHPNLLRPDMSVPLSLREGGQRLVTVLKVGTTVVDVDLNHPLAGHSLRFDIEITAIRDANAEEIEHRHAHGPDGHPH